MTNDHRTMLAMLKLDHINLVNMHNWLSKRHFIYFFIYCASFGAWETSKTSRPFNSIGL